MEMKEESGKKNRNNQLTRTKRHIEGIFTLMVASQRRLFFRFCSLLFLQVLVVRASIFVCSLAMQLSVCVTSRWKKCSSLSFDSLDWCHCINIDKLCAPLLLTILAHHISCNAPHIDVKRHKNPTKKRQIWRQIETAQSGRILSSLLNIMKRKRNIRSQQNGARIGMRNRLIFHAFQSDERKLFTNKMHAFG